MAGGRAQDGLLDIKIACLRALLQNIKYDNVLSDYLCIEIVCLNIQIV